VQPTQAFSWAVTLTTLFLVFGGLDMSAASEPSGGNIPAMKPAVDPAERRPTSQDSRPAIDTEAPADDSSESQTVEPGAPWRRWPRPPGSAADDIRTMDGPLFTRPDGRLCWPHGDHVHCR
jgi:hypothetical protein